LAEARLYAKNLWSGADPPMIYPKTLCFAEHQFTTIIEFHLNEQQSSGHAWGEKRGFQKTHLCLLTLPEKQRFLALTLLRNIKSNIFFSRTNSQAVASMYSHK
jgi:hypothetical protein